MSMKQHLKVILTRDKTINMGLSMISAEKCRSGRFNNHRRDRPASFFALTENHTLGLTRSSWVNYALRDDEAVYWVSIGHFEAVAVGN